MSIERGMDKEVFVHMQSGILFSYEREWNQAICKDVDGSRHYQSKWSNS